MKVVLKYKTDKISNGYEKVFENVTRVKSFVDLGFFDNYMVLYDNNVVLENIMFCDLESIHIDIE